MRWRESRLRKWWRKGVMHRRRKRWMKVMNKLDPTGYERWKATEGDR